ncbi:hypothetical protein B0A48_10199 [Cryoendolithus antarcticus]|uniref:Cytochrome P450 n=1 Tax=Cryoendolithus antarcticus TaxID=1507870 RepID=A0A1V8SWI4_9PEZI|nr:hypothetical protein B0A48_10199 [Cryoendolithus antarcticus]
MDNSTLPTLQPPTASIFTTLLSNGPSYLTAHPVLLVLAVILLLLATTRYLSSRSTPPRKSSNGSPSPIPAVSYTLPLLGHLPAMAYDAAAFTRNLRDIYRSSGAYSLNFGGTVHNIIFAPALATSMLNQPTANAEAETVFKSLMGRVFGWPIVAESEGYDAFLAPLNALYVNFSSKEPLDAMVGRTAERVRAMIGEFVTGNESQVDQTLWERFANAEVKRDAKGEEVVEVDLLELVRDWCARAANASIIGSDFVNNFPEFWKDLYEMDRGFLLLATGLPRWLPIPPLTRAHLARKRMLDSLELFERAVDKHGDGEDAGAEWRELDDVGPVVKGRLELYRKYGISMRARAATELALMWAANANSNSLVFWMLERVYADKALLALLRREIAPYARPAQSTSDFGMPELPRIEVLDVEGICSSCPLLKSCYIECLRVDTASWSLKIVKEDFVLAPRDKEAQRWMLRKGEFAHVAHDLHNTDPNVFEHPDVWKPDRHVKYDEDGKVVGADFGSMRPYGGGGHMCKGRQFAYKECMMFVAAIIAMWDIDPVGGGEWKMPKHKKATGVYNTSSPTRVWVKRRTLP